MNNLMRTVLAFGGAGTTFAAATFVKAGHKEYLELHSEIKRDIVKITDTYNYLHINLLLRKSANLELEENPNFYAKSEFEKKEADCIKTLLTLAKLKKSCYQKQQKLKVNWLSRLLPQDNSEVEQLINLTFASTYDKRGMIFDISGWNTKKELKCLGFVKDPKVSLSVLEASNRLLKNIHKIAQTSLKLDIKKRLAKKNSNPKIKTMIQKIAFEQFNSYLPQIDDLSEKLEIIDAKIRNYIKNEKSIGINKETKEQNKKDLEELHNELNTIHDVMKEMTSDIRLLNDSSIIAMNNLVENVMNETMDVSTKKWHENKIISQQYSGKIFALTNLAQVNGCLQNVLMTYKQVLVSYNDE